MVETPEGERARFLEFLEQYSEAMGSRRVAEIAFGVLGIYFMASSASHAAAALTMFLGSWEDEFRLVAVIEPQIMLACGVAIWMLRRRLASWLVPVDQLAAKEHTTIGLQSAAIGAIGIYFFATGMSYSLEQLFTFHKLSLAGKSFPPMIVGAGLFFGAGRLVSLAERLRPRDLPKD